MGNPYYRQMKNGKLKFLTVLYLRYRGKRDAKLHIIRENEKQQYMSPFIEQEIHLFTIALKMEQESFMNTLIKTQIQIESAQLQSNTKESMKEQCCRLDSTLLEDKKIYELEQSITAINSQKQEMLLLKKREKEILQLRCDQLYNIFLAKISVYWSGVLKADNKEQHIPPVFTISDYLPNFKIPCDDL